MTMAASKNCFVSGLVAKLFGDLTNSLTSKLERLANWGRYTDRYKIA